MVLILVLVAYLVAPAMGAVFEPEQNTIEYEEGESVSVVHGVDGEVIVNDDDTVDLTLSDDESTQTETLSVGQTTTFVLESGEIDATLEDSDETAGTVEHQYDSTITWNDGAASLVAVMVIFAIIGMIALVAAPVVDL